MNLWAGRFSKKLDEKINDFNSSIRFDSRLYRQDIAGSIIHAEMLSKQGIISEADCLLIVDGLSTIQKDIESGVLEIDLSAEDIHMFVEAELTNRIGDAGKRLHTARSRNDQVALDAKTYVTLETENIIALTAALIKVIVRKAEEQAGTVMPGYTHLQRAQPITFGHHLLAYSQMFLRDIARLKDALTRMKESCPLGSGALAGTTYPIDRFHTAAALGYNSPSLNSIDGVSDRDYMLEAMSCFSILMMHLSRFSEEVILWCSWEFKFATLDDAFATGSSIMPQKKNPDIAELVRGKTGRVYGDLFTLLTVMKGLPLAYNKDMQEDKEAMFDAIDTVKNCLEAFAPMLETLTVNKSNMLKAAAEGFINATDCADYLASKGLPFRDAYTITGKLVAHCIEEGKILEQLEVDKYKTFSPLFEPDIYEAIDLINCVSRRTSYGAPGAVDDQIEMVKKQLKNVLEEVYD